MTTNRPTYLDMIKEAISETPSSKGLSRQGIKKYLKDRFELDSDTTKVKNHIANAIKKGCENDVFATPDGLSGKIKLVKKPAAKTKSKAAGTATPVDKKKATPPKEGGSTNKTEDNDAESDEADATSEAEEEASEDSDLEDLEDEAPNAKAATRSKGRAPAKAGGSKAATKTAAKGKKSSPKAIKTTKSKSSTTKKASAGTKASSSKKATKCE